MQERCFCNAGILFLSYGKYILLKYKELCQMLIFAVFSEKIGVADFQG